MSDTKEPRERVYHCCDTDGAVMYVAYTKRDAVAFAKAERRMGHACEVFAYMRTGRVIVPRDRKIR